VNAYNEDTRTWHIDVYQKQIAALEAKIASTDRRNRKYIAELEKRIGVHQERIKRWTDWH
jgi:uncharacterized small protein (DUF1192 family)